MADDYRNTYNGAGALGGLTPGGTASGTIEIQYDEDIFAITLVAGRTYTFAMQGASSGFTLADPSFYLRDQGGSAVGFSSQTGTVTNDSLTFTARAGGTYYLDTFGAGGTGTYRILADTGFVDDYRDTYADTVEALGNLTPGGSASGTVETRYDQDILAIGLVAGRTYTMAIQGASSGFTLADPSFYLRDQGGSAVGFSSQTGTGTNDSLVFTARASGTYYVDVSGAGGTGTYRVSSDTGFVDDYRDTYADTVEALGRLTPGGNAAGTIETSYDQDILAIRLVAGRTYTMSIEGASSGFTLADPSFYLRDKAGSAVGFSSQTGTGTNDALVFTARATGTYYVDVSGSGGTGTYRVSSDAGFVDDYRDTYADTVEALGSLTPGGSATGTLERAYDQDLFAIGLVAGRSYTLTLQGASSGFTLADPSFTLRDKDGVAVGFSTDLDGASTDDRLVFTAGASATYYVDVSGGGGTGTYRVVATAGAATPDDFRDTHADSAKPLGTVAVNGSGTGRIGAAGDKDVFAVTLTAGETYAFDLASYANGGTALDNAFLRLLDASGRQLFANNNFNGTDSHLTFKAVSGGTYYLEAGSATTSGTGNYLVSARTGYDDYRGTYDGTGTLGSLKIDGSLYGTVERAGDKDVFAVTLTAGETYAFDLARTGIGGAALDNAFLRLLDASGRQLFANNNFNGTDSHLTFKAVSGGTYYLEAGSATSSGTGNYLVSARTGYDDYRGTIDGTGTLGKLGIDASLYGTVETGGDRDVVAVTLVAGQSYTFDLSGTAIGGTVLADAHLSLFGGSGTLIQVNDDFNGSNARLSYVASSSGTHYLEIRSATTTGSGNYLVSAKRGFDDHADTITDPASPRGVLAIDRSRMGTIETAGDTDVFQFDLVAGHTYSLKASGGSAAGRLRDPELHLLDSSGTILAHDDDANGTLDPEILFTAGTTGVHYLEVAGVKSGIGAYQIGVFDLS